MDPTLRGAIVLLAAVFWTNAAAGQVQINSRALELTLTGRVHAQFNTTTVDGETASDFLIRRARFTADVKINDLVSGRIMPDFGEGNAEIRDAYVRLTFSHGFRVTAGQFKRPFDLFQLTSSTQILVIERAGKIRGVDDCAGPGGMCSLSQLTEKLGFSDRDIGVQVDGETQDGRVSYALAVTNGAGANTEDENGTKSYTGRVVVTAANDVRIGANLGVHDYLNEVTGEDDYAVAVGGDIEVGNFDEGVHVQGGAIVGRNWANLDPGGDASTFATIQAIVSYKRPVTGTDRISAVEPVGRISWGDPDTSNPDDAGVLLTPGVVLHFIGRNKIAGNLDIWVPADGSTEASLKFQMYLHF